MPRGELLDRVEAELARWETRPPRTDGQRASRAELSRIITDMMPGMIAGGLDALRDLLAGRPNDYWETPAGGKPPGPGAAGSLRWNAENGML